MQMRYPARISKVHLLKVSYPIFFSNLTIPLVGLIDTFLINLGGWSYILGFVIYHIYQRAARLTPNVATFSNLTNA